MADIEEKWAPVPVAAFATAYEVSNKGRVRSVPRIADSEVYIRQLRGVILKGRVRKDGHRTVNLCFRRERQQCYVRQLVADAFIPNPENLPFVINVNGDRLDCSVLNLERVTAERNNFHAIGMSRKIDVSETKARYSSAIIATCLTSGISTAYRGKKALREAGFDTSAVYGCLSGRMKSHRGHTFEREPVSC